MKGPETGFGDRALAVPSPAGWADLGDPVLWFRLVAGMRLPDPAELEGDARFLALALKEGLAGIGLCSPNPSVGCVLVKEGRVIGRGGHLRAGGPHAEILALRDALSQDHDPAGATAYVTLEPCCHHGRTPPCTDALVAARIARVVAGAQDPNPLVAGGGLRRLREAGVAVASGVLEAACTALHRPFFKRIRTGLPLVILLEHSAPRAGSEEHFRWLRASLRRGADAFCVDGPSVLSLGLGQHDPWPPTVPFDRIRWRVLLDPTAQLDPAHGFMAPSLGQPLLRVLAEPKAALPAAEDFVCGNPGGQLDLSGLLRHLSTRDVSCILVEGCPPLTHMFRNQGLVDVVLG